MILLSGQTLTAKTRFQPVSMALNLAERSSTATMVIGPEAPELSAGNWLKENAEGPGNGIIWRIRSIDRGIETGTRTCQLEHIVNTLRDYVIFGEIRARDITHVASDTECTAKQAANYVLREYPLKADAIQLWQLGNLASAYNNIKNPYHFDGETLFEAMETISGSLEDCFWTYDLRSLPFKLNLTKLSDTVSSEMRMSRNIQTMRVTVDRSQMYTRLYAVGKNDMQLEEVRNSAGTLVYPAKYHENNVSKYGIIAKVETDQSIDSQSELRSWAKARVKKHSQPTVTVTISGLDLSEATGESLDNFTLGKICRVPLPDLGETFNERVVKLAYSDTVSEPERVTVTLANELRDVAKILNEQSSSGRRSSRAGVKAQGEDHAWIVDDTEHVQIIAEAIIGKGEDGVDWSRVSDLSVDGDGISARVKKTEGDIVTQQGDIKVADDKVSMVVKVRDDNTGYLIKAAEICTAINEDGEGEAIIDAAHVRISGDTTIAGMLTVDNGALKVRENAIFAGRIEMIGNTKESNYIHTRRVQLYSGGDIQVVGAQAGEQYTISDSDLTGFVRELQLTESSGTYTLQYRDKKHGTTWQDVGSFKRATSLSGEWSGSGKVTVSADDSAIPVWERLLSAGAKENEDGSEYTTGNVWYVPINAVWGSSGQYSESTGFRTYVNASGRYDAGWGAAEDKVKFPHETVTNHNDITVEGPSETVGNKVTRNYYLWNHGNNAVDLLTQVDGNEVTVARWSHNKYDLGWGEAFDEVKLPITESTNRNEIWIYTPAENPGSGYSLRTYIMETNGDSVELKTLVEGSYVVVAKLSVAISSQYASGWGAAWRQVNLPIAEVTNNNQILVKVPTEAVDGGYVGRSYYLWNHGDNAVDLLTMVGETEVTVARWTHNKYNTGWGDAYDEVSLPITEKTNSNMIEIHTPKSTVGGGYNLRTYIMQTNGDAVDLQTLVDGSYVTVARLNTGASAQYGYGWKAAWHQVNLPIAEVTNNNTILVKVPTETVDGGYDGRSYYMWNYGDNAVDLLTMVGETEVTVARLTHNKYTAGWGMAYSKVILPTAEVTNHNNITVEAPSSSVNVKQSRTYYMFSSSNNAVDLYTMVGETETTVARITHGKYNSGWGDARKKVSLPTASDTKHNDILVSGPSATVGNTESRDYYMGNNGDDAVGLFTMVDGTETMVARWSHGKYTSGWKDARKKVSLPTAVVTNKNDILVAGPGKDVGDVESRDYYMADNGNDTVDLYTMVDKTETTVARWKHNKYTKGWKDAWDKVVVPNKESTNSNTILIKFPLKDAGKSDSQSFFIENEDDNNNAVRLRTSIDNGKTYFTVARFSHGKYTVNKSEISISKFEQKGQMTDISGRTKLTQTIKKGTLTAPGYIFIDVKVRGVTKQYYLVVNP